MGGVCPFCPATRIDPMDADTTQVVVRFNEVPIVHSATQDVGVQTDLPSPWATEVRRRTNHDTFSVAPLTSIVNDSSFNTTNSQTDTAATELDLENNPLMATRRSLYHKSFATPEYEEHIDLSDLRNQVNDIKLTLGVLYDDSDEQSMAMVEELRPLFKNLEFFEAKFSNEDHKLSMSKQASSCDCFIVLVRGELLPEKAAHNFTLFLPSGSGESKSNPFYAKPTVIACDPSEKILIGELRNFLSSIGAVVMPTILTVIEQLTDSKSINELKLYATALKLIKLATLTI